MACGDGACKILAKRGTIGGEHSGEDSVGKPDGRFTLRRRERELMSRLALALGLQQNPSPIATPPILISDLDILLPLQAHNIALNSLSSDSIISIELPWGSEVPSSLPASHRHPDTLLAADCVYFEPAFPLLQETMLLLMTEETICWFCHKKRRKADMRFILEMKKKFVVREIKTLEVFGNNGIFL